MDQVILPIPSVYSDLQQEDYFRLLTGENNLSGSGISDIVLYEKDYFPNSGNKQGAGFLSFLGSVARKAIPFISRYILPEAINFGSNLINKKRQNPDLKREDFKNEAKKSMKNIAEKVLNASGGKKTYIKKSKIKKKKKDHRRIKKKKKVRKINKKKIEKTIFNKV